MEQNVFIICQDIVQFTVPKGTKQVTSDHSTLRVVLCGRQSQLNLRFSIFPTIYEPKVSENGEIEII